ncbi:MAG: hypothetical protein U0X75_01195 [Acidobacteriota bacterium]
MTVLMAALATLTGATDIANVAPGIFSADASGKAWHRPSPCACVRRKGKQVFEPVARYDAAQKVGGTLIELNIPGEQVYWLFGTGLRHRET